MRTFLLVFVLFCVGLAVQRSYAADDPRKIPFDTYSGYFVSNKFEPKAAESFAVISDQKKFDEIFGVAVVMGDKSHRLAADALKSNLVLTAIKRGKEVWEFKVENASDANGNVLLEYAATSKRGDSAEFACPLIVSIPKGKYKTVEFVENGKLVKTIRVKSDAIE